MYCKLHLVFSALLVLEHAAAYGDITLRDALVWFGRCWPQCGVSSRFLRTVSLSDFRTHSSDGNKRTADATLHRLSALNPD